MWLRCRAAKNAIIACAAEAMGVGDLFPIILVRASNGGTKASSPTYEVKKADQKSRLCSNLASFLIPAIGLAKTLLKRRFGNPAHCRQF